MDYHYSDNTNAKLNRRRAFLAVVVALCLTLALVAGYVIYDALTATTQVTVTPPTTSTLGQQAEQTVFNERFFRLVADPSWQSAPPLEEDLQSFRFQSYENNLVRRELTIYVDSLPAEQALTHVLPVEADGHKVVPLSISKPCRELQPDKDNKRDTNLSWAGVEFLCDPDLNAHVIGTSHAETGYGLRLKADTGRHSFFFLYKDLEAVAELDHLPRLLKGFEAK